MTTSNSDVTIRLAEAPDFDQVGRLGAQLVEMHHAWDPQRFMVATRETARGYGAYLGSQLVNPDVVMFVAVVGDQVLGYTYASVEDTDYMALRGPAGVLHDVMVDPAHRGQGIGQRLLRTTLFELERRGAPRVVLSTAAANEAAQRLFARIGFRRTMVEMTRESGSAN